MRNHDTSDFPEKLAAFPLLKEAEAGEADAMFRLGELYMNELPGGPHGGVYNGHSAAFWYERAAQKGHIEALYKLGLCYLHGSGGAADMERRRMNADVARQNAIWELWQARGDELKA